MDPTNKDGEGNQPANQIRVFRRSLVGPVGELGCDSVRAVETFLSFSVVLLCFCF